MKNTLVRLSFALFLVAFAAISVSAQVDPPDLPPCDDPNNPFSDPCPIPIDGGLVFLIAAGAAYGGRKAYELKSKQ